MESSNLSLAEQQMGRPLASGTRVIKKCRHGMPMVVDVPHSIIERTPTLFWLTCPELRSRVGTLEEQGFLRLMTEKVRADEILKRTLWERCRALSEQRRFLAAGKGITLPASAIRASVDGGRDPLFVKCLHAHLADYMAGNRNPVGEMVAACVSEPACSEACCQK